MHKTIGLDESSYALLKREKRPGESFSDVVRRLTAPSGDWRALIGILGKDGDRMAAWLNDRREQERTLAKSKWRGMR